ncbi:thioredoxin domain-containing protein [Patescibacteria group bacterium]|jgi:protein-disulfide isomerase|nr:thioredoxin domain-containing protein [Patescibacteria group bacterium]
MNSAEQTKKIFLLGTILLVALVVGGLVWAISAGPGGSVAVESGVTFKDDNDPAKGPGEAKVVVRLFGDFQCPACKASEPGVNHAIKTYGDQVRFVWNDFPLIAAHPNARPAANAARCAEDQGKFWEYHDVLYDKQTDWQAERSPKEKFVSYAGQLGLNTGPFTACLDDRTFDWKVMDDQREGISAGVQATPTFFIGTRKYQGGMSAVEWDAALQPLLQSGS